jgi:hypothetical protein
MSEPERFDSPPSPLDRGIDPAAAIASLRQRGGARIDPVRFHFMEDLAKRAQAQPAPVRRVLEAKLAKALAEYGARLAQVPDGAEDSARPENKTHPAPLADLVRHIRQRTAQELNGDSARDLGDHADLKALRYFRDTWSKLSVDQTVAHALATGPANAGPLNSHSLVLQSLQSMRDSSPEYLNRFMAYADALLWLDQANSSTTSAKGLAIRRESKKKRQSK